MIEGIKTSNGLNDSQVIEYIQKNPEKLNEGSYAAKLGIESNTPFLGGEADSVQIKQAAISSGIPVKEFVTFLVLRSMASFNKANSELSLTKALNKCYSYLEEEYALSRQEVVHEKEFLVISEKLLGKKFDYNALSTMDVAPICVSTATKAQQVNCQINKIRNKHLVSTIFNMLAKYDNFLVVYGAGHLVQIDPALRSFLDKE